jgi:hypothetical protein
MHALPLPVTVSQPVGSLVSVAGVRLGSVTALRLEGARLVLPPWSDGLARFVSRRAGGVGARWERVRRRGRHRRLTTSPTKPAQPARATVALASGRRRSRGIPGVRGLRDRKEPTWKTIGPTIGPTASACCSISSTVPARSLRYVWTGWPRRRASRRGRRCPQEGRRAAHRRGVPVGAGIRRLLDPPPRRGHEPQAVRAGRVADRRRPRRPRPDPGHHDRLAAGAPALGLRRDLGMDLRRTAPAARGPGRLQPLGRGGAGAVLGDDGPLARQRRGRDPEQLDTVGYSQYPYSDAAELPFILLRDLYRTHPAGAR